MKKIQLLKKIDQAWSDFTQSYANLPDTQIMESGVTGDWSVKDILAHVCVWEQEALKHLPTILAGRRPPRYSALFGGIDAFNAQMTEERRKLTLAEVQNLLVSTHSILIDYLQSLPEETFAGESSFRRRLRLDTYSHYPIHTRAILGWREQSG